jgi:rhodanese-related sulfurtransferase
MSEHEHEFRSHAEARAHALAAYERWAVLFHELPAVSHQELLFMIQNGKNPILVDVRSVPELDVSRIAGSVTPEEFEASPARHSARHVVSICTIGLRAGLWATRLQRSGYAGPIFVSEGVLLHVLDGGGVVSLRGASHGAEWQSVMSIHCFGEGYRFAPDGWDCPVFSRSESLRYTARFFPGLVLALLSTASWKLRLKPSNVPTTSGLES